VLLIWLFKNQKKADKIWRLLAFFSRKGIVSGKTLPELHIHYKSLLTRVYHHTGCEEYRKDFT